MRGGDPWTLMYTSGTTGKPKGAIRSHRAARCSRSSTDVELGLQRATTARCWSCRCATPIRSISSAPSPIAARACTVYSRKSFDPEHLLRTLADGGATFTSLVPTHYIMMLGLPAATRARYNVDAVTKLMISSAPARRDTKLAIMEYFRNSGLFELYGSTEAGWVTMLHPDEQFDQARLGRPRMRRLARRSACSIPTATRWPTARPASSIRCNPYTFDGYWKLPDKTAEAFRGDYCTVGDMARRDADGYIYLVDRKSNMIISGGENVYPSEVESAARRASDKVKDVAVIGVADAKWGERVHAVIVLRDGASAERGRDHRLVPDRIAGYKRPRSVSFIARRRDAAHRDRQDSASRAAHAARAKRSVAGRQRHGDAARRTSTPTSSSCAAWIARFLKARGVDRIFGLQGGHIQPIWDHVARQGIRIIDVRDEGAAVHMAHAHAELTGQLRRRHGDRRARRHQHASPRWPTLRSRARRCC